VPWRYALGAVAALARLDPTILTGQTSVGNVLEPLWREASPDPAEKGRLTSLIETALAELRTWRAAGFPDLEIFYSHMNI